MVVYTEIVESTKGSFKSFTATAPAAETQTGGEDIKMVTLGWEGLCGAGRWH